MKHLILFAGPCQIESLQHALDCAGELKNITEGLPVKLYYKSSFDKANRTSLNSERGAGLERGLEILARVKRELNIPVITDIHTAEQAAPVAEVADVLQIPAFLCRQTDILVAAGKTGKAVNIKKGQFLHPADMAYSAEKVLSGGTSEVYLCERGSSFGYRDLVVDPRGMVIMKSLGYPVIFDATHSVQSMGGAGGKSGGQREFILPLSRAAMALGVSGLFVECHQDPDRAPSDGPNMLPLKFMREYLDEVIGIYEAGQK